LLLRFVKAQSDNSQFEHYELRITGLIYNMMKVGSTIILVNHSLFFVIFLI